MSIFMQEAGRPGLFSTAVDRPFDPLGGLGSGNPFSDMMLASGMSYLFGSRGFTPGQFFPTQNVYDQMQAARQQQQRMAAVSAGFEADAPEMMATMRGLTESMGLEFGPAAMRMARAVAGAAPSILPFAASMAPQTVDALFGYRGSRGVAADVIFRRGRHEVDPVTGLTGLSVDSTAARASGLYDELYGGAPGEGLGRMRGMGAGSAAMIAAEASRLGLGPAPVGAMSAAERSAALGGAEATPEALRGFDARKTADSVRDLAGAVSAIRDLFGANGRADAPMSTLFKALNDLTQGGLQFASPQKLESDVRTAQALMRNGGMTLDAFAALTARGGQAAAAMGLDQGFGASAAQGAAAAGVAYQTAGLGAFRGPGAFSREAFTAREVELRASATASGQASQLAAFVAFQEQVGGLKGRDLELYEAVKNNRSTYADGSSIRLEGAEAVQRLSAYVGAGAARDLVANREGNMAYVAKYDIGSTVRGLQPDELRRDVRSAISGVLSSAGTSAEIAAAGSKAATAALFGLSGADASDPTKQVDAIAGAMVAAGVDPGTARLSAARGLGAFGEVARRRLDMSPIGALQMFNDKAVRETERRRSEAKQEAAMQQAMSALGRPGPLARLAEIVKGPKEGLVDGIATFLGGVPIDEVGRTLGVAAAAATPGQRLSVVAGGVNASLEAFEAVRAAGGPDAAARASELAEQVGTLVSGDASQAARALAGLRGSLNLSDDAMARLERGEAVAGVDAATARRVRSLAYVASGRGNLLGAAEQAGVRTKAGVSGEELAAAAARARAYASADPAKMTPEARARSGRDGAAAVAEADRIAGLAIADESGHTIESMGGGRNEGAVTAVKLIRDDAAAIRAIAAKEGVDVAALLGSGEAGGAAAEARAKASRIAAHVEHLRKLGAGKAEDYGAMAPDDPRRKRRDAELGRLKEAREASPEDAARDQLKAILDQTGTAISDDDRDELAGRVAGSADPGAALAGLRRAADAEAGLRKAEAGGADARAIDALAKAAGPLAGLRQGGAASAAESARILAEAVDGGPAKGGGGAGPGGKEPLRATFTPGTKVKIEGDELAFSGGIQLEGGLGVTIA